MKSDILDIVFENRNKEYGAYNLRKFYQGRLKTALGFMFIISITFWAFTLIPAKKKFQTTSYVIPDTKIVKVNNTVKPPQKKQQEKKQAVLLHKKITPVKQKMFVRNTQIVPDNVKTDSIKEIEPDDRIGNVTIQTPDKTSGLIPVKIDTGNDIEKDDVSKVDKNKLNNEDEVDVLPSYPGGMNALMKFLQKNLQTPDELQYGQTVNVRIRFVVGYNGKLQNFNTVLDAGEAYSKEVIRVLKKMPNWNPGKSKGEDVSVYYTIPVKFVSEN